jgi:quercetin dioxygenase-like cupin family protein
MRHETGCFVVLPTEGRRIDLGDFEMVVKADAETTGGVVSVLEATEPPGFGPPIHVHDDAAEAFYVLQGEYVMSLDSVGASSTGSLGRRGVHLRREREDQ